MFKCLMLVGEKSPTFINFLMDPITLSALIAAGGSLISGLAGGAMSAKANKDSQNRAINAQQGLQSMLLSNAGTVMARNAKQAGLSPAFNLASSNVPTASSVSAPQTNYDLSSFADLLGKIPSMKLQHQQYKVAKQQERVDNANADIAEEKAKQEKINTLNMQGRARAFENNESYVDNNGELVVSAPRSLTGAQGFAQGELERAQIDLQKQGFSVQSIKYDIEEGVYNRQKGDNSILSALADRPVAEIEQLKAHASELLAAARSHDANALKAASERAYIDVQKEFVELQSNEYKSGSVDALFKDFSMENFFKWFLRNLLNVVNIGAVKSFK